MTTYSSGISVRWVIREVEAPVPSGEPYTYKRTDRILQYGLTPINGGKRDWFDVPVEVETPAS